MTLRKRPKNTKEIVRKIFSDHPNWNAREIYDQYVIEVGGSQKAVTLNAVQKQIEKIKPHYEEMQKRGLDKPWSIGVCEKHQISCNMAPILIREQLLRVNTNLGPGHLTIREAKWLTTLYPVMMPVVQRLFSRDENPDILHAIVSLATRQYAFRELSSEIAGEEYPNTTDLDSCFFRDSKYFVLLREQAEDMWKAPRDPRYVEKEPEIDGFITFMEETKNVDITPIPPIMTIEEQLEKRRQENER